MALPPEWLVEWTKYVLLVITTIAAARALCHGGAVLRAYVRRLQ
jgi:hypothetical protein